MAAMHHYPVLQPEGVAISRPDAGLRKVARSHRHQSSPPTEATAPSMACERSDQLVLALALAVFFAGALVAVSVDGGTSAVTGAVLTVEQRPWNSALALVS